VYAGYEADGANSTIRIYNAGTNSWRTPVAGPPNDRGVTGFALGELIGSTRVVYVTVSGTDSGRVYRAADDGRNWVNVTNDLPPLVNVTCLLMDSFNPNVLYLGSDFGVFGSANRAQNWVSISDGLPAVPMVNCIAQRYNGEVLLGTWGRGVYAAPRGVPVSVAEPGPVEYQLDQNFPNPFNPLTSIGFTIPARAHVRLTIFDATGREVETLLDGVLDPGRQTVRWNATRYASGVYYYRLAAGDWAETKKMALLR
jgi:hypothetical protein